MWTWDRYRFTESKAAERPLARTQGCMLGTSAVLLISERPHTVYRTLGGVKVSDKWSASEREKPTMHALGQNCRPQVQFARRAFQQAHALVYLSLKLRLPD